MLFDFDGPLCRLFHGYPTADVASSVLAELAAAGGPVAGFERSRDMHDVLRTIRGEPPWSELPEYLVRAERELTRQEIAAVASALPTPGAEELLRQLTDWGIGLAIASNNSARAVSGFLRQHGLSGYLRPDRIIGRAQEPGLMKPHPDPIERALTALGDPERETCILLGDSLADAGAASRAGIRFAGFVRPDREDGGLRERELRAEGAIVVVARLKELLSAFRWESVSEDSSD